MLLAACLSHPAALRVETWHGVFSGWHTAIELPTSFLLPTARRSCRAALGQLPVVTVLFRSVPVVHHLLGPLDSRPRQPRQVAARQAKRRAPVGEL
jgi:hypothetical protein